MEMERSINGQNRDVFLVKPTGCWVKVKSIIQMARISRCVLPFIHRRSWRSGLGWVMWR